LLVKQEATPRSHLGSPPTTSGATSLPDGRSATASEPPPSRTSMHVCGQPSSRPSALPATTPPEGGCPLVCVRREAGGAAWLARGHRRSCGQGPAGASPGGGVGVGSCGSGLLLAGTPKVLPAWRAHDCVHQGSSRPDGVRRSTRPAVSRPRRRPVPLGRWDLERCRRRRGTGGAGITAPSPAPALG